MWISQYNSTYNTCVCLVWKRLQHLSVPGMSRGIMKGGGLFSSAKLFVDAID